MNKNILIFLSAIVWYIGAITLFFKAISLFFDAYQLNSNIEIFIIVFISILVIVFFKVKYIFLKVCRKNIERIEALRNPKIWQFYRVRFFIFLITMISLGAYLSRAAEGEFWFLVAVGILDMSVGLSLLFSSFVFWKR